MKITQLGMFGAPSKVMRLKRARKPKNFEGKFLVSKVLQLGAGRQSSAIAEMIAEGDLPRIDYAIFADTGDEPQWVYDQVAYLTKRLASVGIPLYVVKSNVHPGGIVEAVRSGGRFASMPLYTGYPGIKKGILRRQCSNEWKVIPAESYTRQWMVEHGHAFVRSNGARVIKRNLYIEQWYGIAADESYRVKERGPNWQKSVYPLVDLGWSTEDCLDYLKNKGLPIPGQSACRVCPYHDDMYWLMLKTYHLADFEHACQFDDWLRTPEAGLSISMGKIIQECYLHASCIPLREVDFAELIRSKRQRKTHISYLQLRLFEEELISGKCASDGGGGCFE